MKSGQSLKQRHKHERQESLRELLSRQKHVEKVIDNVNKIEDLDQEINKDDVARLKIGIETRMKLINKYLPDLKAVDMEVTGENGNALIIQAIGIKGVDASNRDTK